jgi:acetolactate synthase regulatory subunit
MSHILHVRLRKAEGSLLRLLGQIGRRGYDILGLSAKLSADGKAFDVDVEFEPFMPIPPAPPLPRPVEMVVLLVSKLCDVESAELKGAAVPRPAAGDPGNGASRLPDAKPAARGESR